MENLPLVVEKVNKTFGKTIALKHLNVSLVPGDIYALIGPNGSGKTTFIKIVVGLLDPDTGTAKISGYDIDQNPVEAKSNFGYLPDGPVGYPFLTGREFLKFAASLKNLNPSRILSHFSTLIEDLGLSPFLDHEVRNYSRGNLQKIAFIAALMGDPKLVIIDEPIVGLDPTSVEVFGRTLKEYTKKGGTVIFVTHILDFAKKYANRYGLLRNGRLIKEGRLTPKINITKIYHSVVPNES